MSRSRGPTFLRLQVEIDFHLSTLRMPDHRPGSPIDQLIDQATGYDQEREDLIEKLKRLRTLWRRWQVVTGQDVTQFIQSTDQTIERIQQ